MARQEIISSFFSRILQYPVLNNGNGEENFNLYQHASRVLKPTENGGYKIEISCQNHQGSNHATITLDPKTGSKSIDFNITNPHFSSPYDKIPKKIDVDVLKSLHSKWGEYDRESKIIYSFLSFIDNIIYFSSAKKKNVFNDLDSKKKPFKTTESNLRNILSFEPQIISVDKIFLTTNAKINVNGRIFNITLEGDHDDPNRTILVKADNEKQEISKIKISCITSPPLNFRDYLYPQSALFGLNNLLDGFIDPEKMNQLICNIDYFDLLNTDKVNSDKRGDGCNKNKSKKHPPNSDNKTSNQTNNSAEPANNSSSFNNHDLDQYKKAFNDSYSTLKNPSEILQLVKGIIDSLSAKTSDELAISFRKKLNSLNISSIKRAEKRSLNFFTHPDKFNGHPENVKKLAEELSKVLNGFINENSS